MVYLATYFKIILIKNMEHNIYLVQIFIWIKHNITVCTCLGCPLFLDAFCCFNILDELSYIIILTSLNFHQNAQ